MDRRWRILDELEQCGDPVEIIKFLTPEELHFVKTYGTPELVGKLRNPFRKPDAIIAAKKAYRNHMETWRMVAERDYTGPDVELFIKQREAEEKAWLAEKLKEIREKYK